jgi:hypothetical protein
MDKQLLDTVQPKREYEPPKIKDLVELSASGEGPFPPLQVCEPDGGGNTPCVSGPGF